MLVVEVVRNASFRDGVLVAKNSDDVEDASGRVVLSDGRIFSVCFFSNVEFCRVVESGFDRRRTSAEVVIDGTNGVKSASSVMWLANA